MCALEKSALECMLKGNWNSIHLTVGAVGIISITTIIAASIVLLITITELGNLGIAHGQVNSKQHIIDIRAIPFYYEQQSDCSF